MSEIPEDIIKVARTAYESMHPDYPNDWELEIIARAVLAERERCALIADGFHNEALKWAKNVRGLENYIDETDSSRIAAAIRGGSHE